MKLEWRKQDKALYLPGKKPVLVHVPMQKFFVIDGTGNPNSEDFSLRVGALYAFAWTLKMMPKGGFTPDGYEEYTMYPLEGVWDGTDDWDETQPLDKNKLVYTIMVRQPDFLTQETFERVQGEVARKKDQPFLDAVRMQEAADGECLQMLHIGPYDDEPASFAQMHAFMDENGLQRKNTRHREIYLGDPRKGAPENRKTVLRYQVERKA